MVLEIPKHEEIFKQRDVRETSTNNVYQDNFNSDDFTVASNTVSLKSKTRYWTAVGCVFMPENPDTDQVTYNNGAASRARVTADANGITFFAQVHLPHGAVITSVTVYGSAAGEVWYMARIKLSDPFS